MRFTLTTGGALAGGAGTGLLGPSAHRGPLFQVFTRAPTASPVVPGSTRRLPPPLLPRTLLENPAPSLKRGAPWKAL